MNTLSSQLTELAGMMRSYIQENYQGIEKIIGSEETKGYFKVVTSGTRELPAQVKLGELENHSPPRPTPKPVFPPIQKPLPPPLRKPLSSPSPNGEPMPKKSAAEKNPQHFELEPMEEGKLQDLSEIRKVYVERFPHLPLLDPPAEEAQAQKSAQESLVHEYPQVALLSFSGNPRLLDFMRNIARAIHMRWGLSAEILPAYQWEQEKGWEGLLAYPNVKLVLASDYGLQTLPGLMTHYNETTRQGQHFLGKVPLLLLSDLTLYLREPHLKQSLWQAICAKIV